MPWSPGLNKNEGQEDGSTDKDSRLTTLETQGWFLEHIFKGGLERWLSS